MELKSELQMQLFSKMALSQLEDALEARLKLINTIRGTKKSLEKISKSENSRISGGILIYPKKLYVYDLFCDFEPEIFTRIKTNDVYVNKSSQTIISFDTHAYSYSMEAAIRENIDNCMPGILEQLKLALPEYKKNSSRYNLTTTGYELNNRLLSFKFIPASTRVHPLLFWRDILQDIVEYSISSKTNTKSYLHLYNIIKNRTLQEQFEKLVRNHSSKLDLFHFLNQFKQNHESKYFTNSLQTPGAEDSRLDFSGELFSSSRQRNQKAPRISHDLRWNKNDM